MSANTEKPKKAKKNNMAKHSRQVSRLKIKFLEYFRTLPIQKLAGDSIGKDETTISRWKEKDKKFAKEIASAKSAWAQEKAHGVKNNEWLLERIMKEHFAERKEYEHGVSEELEAILNRVDKILPK